MQGLYRDYIRMDLRSILESGYIGAMWELCKRYIVYGQY